MRMKRLESRDALPSSVMRNALKGFTSVPSHDLEVYECALEDLEGKTRSRDLKSVLQIRERIYTSMRYGLLVPEALMGEFKTGVERLIQESEKSLVDDLVEGRLGKYADEYLVDLYKDEDSNTWWEKGTHDRDVQLDKDISDIIDRTIEGETIAQLKIYYRVNRETGGLAFNYAEVNGTKMPHLLGVSIWKNWAQELRDQHERL